MKKVSLVFALILGFSVASFAQLGAAKCAWNVDMDYGNQPIVAFNDIVLGGISDSEGEAVYSVSLSADFNTKKASKVVLTEIKTGKKWWMNQVSPGGKSLPAPCNGNQGDVFNNTVAFRSAGTKMVVYVYVGDSSRVVYVFAHKPLDVKFTL